MMVLGSGVSFCLVAFEEEAHLVKLLVEAASALLFHTINHYTFCPQKVLCDRPSWAHPAVCLDMTVKNSYYLVARGMF